MFLKQISILEVFLKGHVTLKTGVMMLKIKKIAGLVKPNFGSNMDKPSHWVTFCNYIYKI